MSSCSTMRCSRSSTNTCHSSRGPGTSVAMIVDRCPRRHARPSDVVGTRSDATADNNPPQTGSFPGSSADRPHLHHTFEDRCHQATLQRSLGRCGLDLECSARCASPQPVSSYRPISNLTTILKVIERLMLDRLRPYMLSPPYLSRLQ